jgi:dolichol-phosphate mannosyltransferase
MKNQLFLIVPVFNEAENLPKLFISFRKIFVEFEKIFFVTIILVDDGSSDNTVDVAMKLAGDLKLEILKQPKNMGPGKAFARAFLYLSGHYKDNDIIVTMEGDNTSRLELIKQMLHRVEEKYDSIYASPYMYGGKIVNTSTWRVFLSTMANLFVKELLGIHGIMTVSSFFRLYTGEFFRKMQLAYGTEIIELVGFECMTEMTMKMVYLEANISEIAMVLDTKARVGKSRMKIWKTILGYISLWQNKNKWMNIAINRHSNPVANLIPG